MSTTSPLVDVLAPPVPLGAPPVLAKVLHVVNGEHYAGAERVQDLLALNLPQHGFEVGFAALKSQRFKELRQSQQTPFIELAMRSRFDLLPAKRLAAVIRDEEYALVHTHTPRTAFIGRLAAAWSGVPVVHHLHSPTTRDTTQRFRNWVNAATERFSLTRVDAVVAVSQSLSRYARRTGIAPDKTFVVPNGVPSRAAAAPRRRPSGIWTLASVALFRPRKGTEVLLHALALLKAARVPVRLCAIGTFESGGYEQEVKSLAREVGVDEIVEWRGFSANVNDDLDRADLFVLPSLFGEGMPMVVLEALAAGLPVVGTNVEGVPEVVRDGLEGLIVPPGDAQALAGAIERFVTGRVDWTAMAANARRRQVERFSQQAMAAGVVEVYRRVLEWE
ncbi:MAG TPA: glycosyltransferase [Pirellulales bacterium]|nr:glycosyltransferase [Pirellulales bacterium]